MKDRRMAGVILGRESSHFKRRTWGKRGRDMLLGTNCSEGEGAFVLKGSPGIKKNSIRGTGRDLLNDWGGGVGRSRLIQKKRTSRIQTPVGRKKKKDRLGGAGVSARVSRPRKEKSKKLP